MKKKSDFVVRFINPPLLYNLLKEEKWKVKKPKSLVLLQLW